MTKSPARGILVGVPLGIVLWLLLILGLAAISYGG